MITPGHPARPPDPGEPIARRVLIVSADIGGGHDAAGRALEERVHQLWPGSRVSWVDTLDAMGPGVGRTFRGTYVTNVGATPWLYEFFWSSLWRHRWFAEASKWFTGSWAGRRLAPVVEAVDPDLILSTYPIGSAGLAWLRRHRGLGVPVGAWVSDFAPHPFWVYSQLDLNVVVHPAALPVAAVAAPGAPLGVCAPLVPARFRPGDRADAARSCGLDPERRAVVVACGSYGFGAVEEAIAALVGIGDGVQVVAVCGRNERLADELARLAAPRDRLVVRGWVDDMPTLLRAAHLLVTNAGGVTALEAWATGVPVVMYRPIAAHGTANAALMAAAGLAETARDPAALVAVVRSRLVGPHPPRSPAAPAGPVLPDFGLSALAGARSPHPLPPPDGPGPSGPPVLEPALPAGFADPAAPPAPRPILSGAPAEPASPAIRRSGTPAEGTSGGPAVPRPASWPLRPQDAFFRYVQSPTVAQQIGVVLALEPRPDGTPLTRAELTALLARRLPAITTLRRRMVTRGPGRRPGWVIDRHVDPAAHLDEVQVAPGDDGSAAMDRFWSEPLALDRPPWRILLIGGLPGGRSRVAVKLHHCLGDGLSAIGVLQRLLDPATARPAKPPWAGPARPAPAAAGLGHGVRERARRVALTARGLARLAAQGPAPATGLNRPLGSPRRLLVTATLPAVDVLRAARACQAHASELMLALTAGALGRIHPAPAPPRLRAMFAVSDDPRRRAPTQGNWTGAVALDLPVRRIPPRLRVALVRQSLRTALQSGEPEAAGMVMRAMGHLPAPLHAALARRFYTSRHLNVIVSYVPAPLRPQLLAGAPIRAMTPVVALAKGVPVGVGILRCGDTFEVGALLDASLAGSGPAFVAALHAELAQVLAEADRAPGRPAGGPVREQPAGAGAAAPVGDRRAAARAGDRTADAPAVSGTGRPPGGPMPPERPPCG